MLSRIEKDEFGEMELPLNAYYGINSLRNSENFAVTKMKIYKQIIKSLAIVKKACALSNYDAGYISLEKIRAIANACDEVINGKFYNQFITDAVQGGSCSAFNTNMNEILANRATEMLGGNLGAYDLVTLEDVNLFQSPNDVVPTAAKHAMFSLAKKLNVEIKKLLKSFEDKSKKYKNVLKLGHSHLKDSLPITFGQLFNSMACTLSRDMNRLNVAVQELTSINLGAGAIGIPQYSDDKYMNNILNRINEFSEVEFVFPKNHLDESRNMDEFVNLAHVLKLMAMNLSKTASDIRLMSSGPVSGFSEISIPVYSRLSGLNKGQYGQTIPEIVNQVCFLIIGKETSISLAAEHGELETNAFSPIVYSLLFDCFEYLRRAVRLLRKFCIEDMVINEENCRKNIENSNGIVVSLLGKVDYLKCVEIVEYASTYKKSIYEACLDLNIMPEEKLKTLLSIDNIKLK
jgi:aspartate ammonia-lyase